MGWERERTSLPSRAARTAAAACLARLREKKLALDCQVLSPRAALQAAAAVLAPADPRAEAAAWVVQSGEPLPAAAAGLETVWGEPGNAAAIRPGPGHASAWPLWFRDTRERAEQPLLYVLRSSSLAGLQAALAESRQQGLFFNEAELRPSAWPRSVQPAVPLWLSCSPAGLPYDPASGAELLAMLRVALRCLYVDGKADFVYFSMHDEAAPAEALSWQQARQAFKGMYRQSAPLRAQAADLRLLGAGRALAPLRQAAALLASDWGMASEVWSCPSYTRLARDGHEAERWNLLHPLARPRAAHIHDCLQDAATPVIAVTGYTQFIAAQIGAFAPGAFQALGADSLRASGAALDPRWIVLTALKSLAADGRLPPAVIGEALRRYGLAAVA